MTLVKERIERKLEKSGRITPRMVLEAYETTGLGVMFTDYDDGSFGEGATRACAFGVLMARDGIAPQSRRGGEFTERIEHLAGRHYPVGFYTGFEGELYSELAMPPNSQWRKGYRDGTRVRRFVLSRIGGAGE